MIHGCMYVLNHLFPHSTFFVLCRTAPRLHHRRQNRRYNVTDGYPRSMHISDDLPVPLEGTDVQLISRFRD
jgi:hypothetical protein